MIDVVLYILIAGFTAYIWTAVISASHIFKPVREIYRSVMGNYAPWFIARKCVKYFADEFVRSKSIITTDEEDTTYDGRTVAGYDMIACRLCAGFWIAMIVGYAFTLPWIYWMAVYGVSYFLTTQERE